MLSPVSAAIVVIADGTSVPGRNLMTKPWNLENPLG